MFWHEEFEVAILNVTHAKMNASTVINGSKIKEFNVLDTYIFFMLGIAVVAYLWCPWPQPL
jgi:hypothetical protein